MTTDPRQQKLERFLRRGAGNVTEELGMPWNELPGHIAWDAVIRLTVHPEKAGLSKQTTLLEVGQILGMYDEDGNDV